MCRLDVMKRCYQVIEILNSNNGISAVDIADRIGVHRRSAYRYIDAASLVLPVVEIQGNPTLFMLEERSSYFSDKTHEGLFSQSHHRAVAKAQGNG